MKVRDRREAWNVANMIFPTDYEKDADRSESAGYPIYFSTAEGMNAWISDLETRLELNMPQKTVTIWIEDEPDMYGESALLRYLQSQMDDFKREEKRYGIGDRMVMKKLDAMIACKEMVESIIQKPVNLQQDGIVTIGL